MNQLKNLIDYLIYAAGVALSLYLYFMVDAFWGIFSIFTVTFLLLIYLLFTTPGTLIRIKYPTMLKILQTYNFIGEKELQTKMDWSETKLHRALYEIAKSWNISPLVLLNKKYYFYVAPSVMDEIVSKVNSAFGPASKTGNVKLIRSQIVGEITSQYGFLTRQLAEIVVSHLQRQMERIPDKWKRVIQKEGQKEGQNEGNLMKKIANRLKFNR